MSNIKIRKGLFDTQLELEHAAVMAGFPSPADDYRHDTLDFNKDYIRHPEASFYGDVEGNSMKDAGIFDGDRVIIDRAVEPHNGSIVVAFWNGEFTMKYLDLTHRREGYIELRPANNAYPVFKIREEDHFEVWGVVVHLIRTFEKAEARWGKEKPNKGKRCPARKRGEKRREKNRRHVRHHRLRQLLRLV